MSCSVWIWRAIGFVTGWALYFANCKRFEKDQSPSVAKTNTVDKFGQKETKTISSDSSSPPSEIKTEQNMIVLIEIPWRRRVFKLHGNGELSIRDMKKAIEKNQDIPSDEQRLFFGDVRLIDDNQTLDSCGIMNNSIVRCHYRPLIGKHPLLNVDNYNESVDFELGYDRAHHAYRRLWS
jgi:hypothetical protein